MRLVSSASDTSGRGLSGPVATAVPNVVTGLPQSPPAPPLTAQGQEQAQVVGVTVDEAEGRATATNGRRETVRPAGYAAGMLLLVCSALAYAGAQVVARRQETQ